MRVNTIKTQQRGNSLSFELEGFLWNQKRKEARLAIIVSEQKDRGNLNGCTEQKKKKRIMN